MARVCTGRISADQINQLIAHGLNIFRAVKTPANEIAIGFPRFLFGFCYRGHFEFSRLVCIRPKMLRLAQGVTDQLSEIQTG